MKQPNIRLTKTRIVGALFALILLSQAVVPLFLPKASATPLLNTLVRFDRLATAQPTTGTVCAKTSAVNGTEGKVDVTFPASFTLGLAATFTTNTTNTGWPTGAAAWLGIGTATAVAGQDVTFPSSDLAVSTLYCFNWALTTAVTTPAAGSYTGAVTTQTAAAAPIDTGTYGVNIVGAGADQITVSATINPSFTLALSGTTDALGTLTTGSVSTSPTPRTATVNTNASNGWYLWGKDSNQGLNSATAGYTINSNCTAGAGTITTLSAGTEGYNLGAQATSQVGGTGTVTIGAPFNSTGTPFRGGGLCSGAGLYQTVASSTGTADTSVVTLKNNASISGISKPGADYTDLETFVGAGLF
jgi:hypothetical protein